MEYIDIYVSDSGFGHIIQLLGRQGTVVATVKHNPWFTVYSRGRVYGQGVEPIEDGIPLIFNTATYVYMPKDGYRVYKVQAPSRDKVPELASSILSKNSGARAGLYNIRYEARVALDLAKMGYKLLGLPTPAAFYPNNIMIETMEKGMEIIRDFKVLVVDIEVLSSRGGFPERGDPILSIAYSIFRLGDMDIFAPEWPERNVRILMPEKDADSIESRRLVDGFFEVIKRERPDLVVTYNGASFDFSYLRPHALRPEYLLTSKHIGITGGDKIIIPHIDLYIMRKYLGSSLGIRSHAAYALEDVALEVLSQMRGIVDIDWLWHSKYIEAERLLDHAKLRDYWISGDQLLYDYIVADVYLTSLLARIWLYSLFKLAILSGIPPTLLQELNLGQLAEYVAVEVLTRFGFYPELRKRTLDYSKAVTTVRHADKDWAWVFTRGKTYAYDYGYFGGNGYKIIELDFAQLYPSDMTANATDPTAIYILDGWSRNGSIEPTFTARHLRVATAKKTVVLLGRRPKKSASTVTPELVLTVIPGYGPLSWFVYKLYTARKETKKLKKLAKKLGKPEYLAPDQAIKILNNAFYGAFSKSRGNLVNEVVSATVFWRTQRLLYKVIDYINKDLAERLGSLRVLYADTDSTYVLAPKNIDTETLTREVNKWLKENFGSFYQMELEGVYDSIIIPKQKETDDPSAKSYLCLQNGSLAKVKGEFYKITAPEAIKERLSAVLERIIEAKPRNREEVKGILAEFLRNEPIHKWFIKKSISSFVNDDDPKKLKRLNREFHYAALYSLLMHRSPGVSLLDQPVRPLDDYFTKGESGAYVSYRFRVDPRYVERVQGAVIVHYLPSATGNPRKFIVLERETGDGARVHLVELRNLKIESEGVDEETVIEKYYVADVAVKVTTIPRDVLFRMVLDGLDKYMVDTIVSKLVPALHNRGKWRWT